MIIKFISDFTMLFWRSGKKYLDLRSLSRWTMTHLYCVLRGITLTLLWNVPNWHDSAFSPYNKLYFLKSLSAFIHSFLVKKLTNEGFKQFITQETIYFIKSFIKKWKEIKKKHAMTWYQVTRFLWYACTRIAEWRTNVHVVMQLTLSY